MGWFSKKELAAPAPGVTAADVDELRAQLAALQERLISAPPTEPPPQAAPVVDRDVLAVVEQHLCDLDARLDALEQRVTSVSTELANQVTELGNDIEPIHQSAERLANEQARYQIAFRQDLAELAERLRRPGNA
jgi:uncharacterized coiled-coil protein SlyX